MEKTTCSNIILDNTMKELNVKGTPELPIGVYNDDLKADPVPYHWHDEIELIVVTSGKMDITVELEKYVLSSGEGIFINSGRLHSCINFEDTDCTLKSFVFNSKFLYGDLNSVLYENYFYSLLKETSINTCLLSVKACSLVLDAYDAFSNQDFAYEFFVRENLTKTLIPIIKNTENMQNPIDLKTTKQLSRCKTMMSFIHQNFDKTITLLDIAKSANVKESEALRSFKSILSTSPVKYLKKYRLQQSAFLLKTTSEPIINIGLSCGFAEISYFTKSFREMYDIPPTKYRKLKQ